MPDEFKQKQKAFYREWEQKQKDFHREWEQKRSDFYREWQLRQDDVSRQNRFKKTKLHKHRHREPERHLFIGLILIMIAAVFVLYQMHWLSSGNWLAVFIIGVGLAVLITGLVKTFGPSRRPFFPVQIVAGGVIVCYGLALYLGLSDWWWLALLVIGIGMLMVFFFLQREARKRRLIQETLHESEFKYGYIIDNANSIIMEADPSGSITYMNSFARSFFGFSDEETPAGGMLGTIIPDGENAAEKQETMLREIAVHPDDYLHTETENTLRNGNKAWIAWSCKPVLDEQNNLKQILCIGIDRTEQKKADDLAAQQMREKTVMEERARLARDLHDAVSQTLFSASLISDVLPRIWERDPEEGKKRLEELRQMTRGSLAEMKTLLFELRPAALADAELGDVLRQLVEAVKGRQRIPITVDIQGRYDLPVDVKVAFYRIAQEALNNISRHSGAGSAQLMLEYRPGEVALQITDDGRGFDTSIRSTDGFGLANMQERANQIDAALTVESKLDQGTSINVVWTNHNVEMKQ